MKFKKTYRSIHAKTLIVYIEVNGTGIGCTFNGGMSYPKMLNGSYATANPDIQKVLESHPGFNKQFEVTKEVALKGDVKKTEPVKETKTTEEPDELVKEGDVIMSEAINGQQAKNELNKKHGVPWSKLKNNAMVKEQAKERGILYPNWV